MDLFTIELHVFELRTMITVCEVLLDKDGSPEAKQLIKNLVTKLKAIQQERFKANNVSLSNAEACIIAKAYVHILNKVDVNIMHQIALHRTLDLLKNIALEELSTPLN